MAIKTKVGRPKQADKKVPFTFMVKESVLSKCLERHARDYIVVRLTTIMDILTTKK